MADPSTGSVRQEAEHLVASVLAGLSATVGRAAEPGCGCPVCRVLGALREPSPALAERLATGAGDIATGVSRVLGALGDLLGPPEPQRDAPAGPDGAEPGDAARR